MYRPGPLADSHSALNTVIRVAGLVLIGLLFFRLMTDVLHGSSVYGTARAPASDAAYPWLRGSLAYLFEQKPFEYLYRPTIGLFFGSIVAIAGRIDAVPVFFASLLCLTVLLALLTVDRALKAALFAWLLLAAGEYAGVFGPVNVGALTPDLPATFLTLAAFCTLLYAVGARRYDEWMVALGFFILGMAAAIRGAMMLSGPALVALVVVTASSQSRSRLLIFAAIPFLSPLALDVVLQRMQGVFSNGPIHLFCFYTDPSRAWTTACAQRYLELKPAFSEIAARYLQALLADGKETVFGNMRARFYADGSLMRTPMFALAWAWAAGAPLVSAMRGISAAAPYVPRLLALAAANRFGVMRSLVLTATVLLTCRLEPVTAIMALSALIAILSISLGIWRPVLCLVAYYLGVVFLGLMSIAHDSRFAHTFSFLLYFAAFLFMCDTPTTREHRRRASGKRLATGAAALFVVLYSAVLWWPSQWKTTFLSQVAGNAGKMMKISEDKSSNLCLFVKSDAELTYYPCDRTPLGTVRPVE